jgi:hypothetical protein
LLKEKEARTCFESEVPLESPMSPSLYLMIVSLIIMNIMLSLRNKRTHCASSGSSVAMLEMVMVEVVLEMAKEMAKAPPSSLPTGLLQR